MARTGLTMAKKKRPTKPSVAREDFIRIRMTAAFKEWLERYADYRNLTVAATVTQALIDDAKVKGFMEPAPKR